MTVGELRNMLDGCDDNMTIVFKPSNSMYGEHIENINESKGVAAFYGNDYKALVLTSGGQCGAICDEWDLSL